MEIFLVGGAVRDFLLGLPVKDKDWVVVGATSQQMIDAGYQKVGRDFPVFLHPKTQEEYALARTEYKSGFGYTGFTCCFSPKIKLEEDLWRRDLTINALAKNKNGEIIDICNGLVDLKNRILRHVSPAFVEDPLRVLRVARFAARYFHLGFSIAEETMKLMRKMNSSGELTKLTPERVWKETEIALITRNPQVYFETLHNCGALKTLFPELDFLFNIQFPKSCHLNINTANMGIHTMKALNKAATLSSDINVRFATLCHELGKGFSKKKSKQLTDQQNYNNYQNGSELIKQISYRFRIPNETRDLARLVIKFHSLVHILPSLNPITIIDFFNNIDAWRKPKRIEQIALVSEADARSKFNNLDSSSKYLQRFLLQEMWKVTRSVVVTKRMIVKFKSEGLKIREDLNRKRIQAIINWKKNNFYNNK